MPLYIIRLGIKTPLTDCVCGSMPPYEMLSTANIITIFEITNSYQKNLQFFSWMPRESNPTEPLGIQNRLSSRTVGKLTNSTIMESQCGAQGIEPRQTFRPN